MTLVTQNLDNSSGSPLDIPKVGLAFQGNERICDLLGSIAEKVHVEGKLNCLRFLRIDDEVAVSIVCVAQQLRRKRNAVVKTHPERGFHTPAACMGLFLCHRCLEGKGHLGLVLQREDRFRLKEDTNRVL